MEIGYEEALKYSRIRHKFSESLKCTNYLFGNDLDRISMVEEVSFQIFFSTSTFNYSLNKSFF